MKARYIAFEGIDGSGKTRQISLLNEYLVSKGHSVLLTKEFGSEHNLACQELRKFALNSNYGFDEMAGQFMFAACSSQHSEQVIAPALEEYDFIISDRSIESNLAYCAALGLKEFAHKLFFLDTRRHHPSTVVFLNVSPETTWARLNKREKEHFSDGGTDRIEDKGFQFQCKVRDEYLERIEHNPNYLVIDCNDLDIETTHKSVIDSLGVS